MENKDLRWVQRFENYTKAFNQLQEAIELMGRRPLSKLEKQGVIQAFEYTHELAWKTIKDFLESRGNLGIYGSRDATKEAFKLNIIENGEAWMQMIKSRNLTSHTYDENTANEIILLISQSYFEAFVQFKEKMSNLKEKV